MTANRTTIIEVGRAILDAETIIDEPVFLVVDDGIITSVEKGFYVGDATRHETVDIIRRPHCIAMPGLVNTHGHAAMTLLRGVGDDMPLASWLQDRIFPLEAKLTEDAIYWGTQLAHWEMLKSGTTTYTDMYMMMDEAAKSVLETGIRGVLSVGVVGFDETSRVQGVKRSRDFAKTWTGAAEGRISVTLGPHAPYTCPPDFLTNLADLASELNVPVQIHLSETRLEVETSRDEYGLTPIGLAEQVGLFQVPTLAAHCVHVTDEDIELMKRHDVHVAHNPQSNLKLGSGIAPLVKMLSHGLTVGLGTDGAASNNNLDMFEEMRLAATLHKGYAEDAQLIDAALAFRLATDSGAKACFLGQGHGTLHAGAPCDLILLDAKSPHFQPNHHLLSNIVYAAGADDVRDVFVAGRQLVSDGCPLTVDTERVMFEVNRIARAFAR